MPLNRLYIFLRNQLYTLWSMVDRNIHFENTHHYLTFVYIKSAYRFCFQILIQMF
jgi:hypothetical protein